MPVSQKIEIRRARRALRQREAADGPGCSCLGCGEARLRLVLAAERGVGR
jgi:hypothetical protein